MLGQLPLVDGRQAAGHVVGQAQLGGELGLPAQQVGGLDEREQCRGLVPPRAGDLSFDVQGELVEARIHVTILPDGCLSVGTPPSAR